jgi:SPP1 family predicted phage head-tail adaptor
MRAGKLRDRVKLQRLFESKDALNQTVQSWIDLGTFWANVMEVEGAERVVAGQVRADTTHVVTTRNLIVDLEPDTHQFIEASGTTPGRRLGILEAIDTDGKNRNFRYSCKAVV